MGWETQTKRTCTRCETNAKCSGVSCVGGGYVGMNGRRVLRVQSACVLQANATRVMLPFNHIRKRGRQAVCGVWNKGVRVDVEGVACAKARAAYLRWCPRKYSERANRVFLRNQMDKRRAKYNEICRVRVCG